MMGEFNTKVGRENVFIPTTGNESLHRDSNRSGVRMANFATTTKHLALTSTIFPAPKLSQNFTLLKVPLGTVVSIFEPYKWFYVGPLNLAKLKTLSFLLPAQCLNTEEVTQALEACLCFHLQIGPLSGH